MGRGYLIFNLITSLIFNIIGLIGLIQGKTGLLLPMLFFAACSAIFIISLKPNNFLQRRHMAKWQKASVKIDEANNIIYQLNANKSLSLPWSDLQEVIIRNTDQGPYVEDQFWVLVGTEITLTIENSADGTDKLLTQLQTLPNFDNLAVIAAMGYTNNKDFLCWQIDKTQTRSQ